ncbi:hypothetical protein B0H13DRAFT_2523357 [Mycena leptocephala]|nr:hypothetical protein B0H13DRAFT_2523357 [Mycena leptocephala]
MKLEIARTQGVVRALEGQRDDAEHAATKARALARKLHVENKTLVALEQGRREGYDAGFEHGKVIAVAKAQEQRRREQRRLAGEIRRRGIAPPTEPRSAFIEEVPGEEQQQQLSRGVLDARRPPAQPEARQRRETLDSVRSAQQRPQAEPAPVINNNQPPPQAQRPQSVSSARRVSAPPGAIATQQQQRPRTTSVDSRADGSRAGGAHAPSRAGTTRSAASASATRQTHPAPAPNTDNHDRTASSSSASLTASQHPPNSTASRNSVAAAAAAGPETANAITNAIGQQNAHAHPRRCSSTSVSRSAFDAEIIQVLMPRSIPAPMVPIPAPASASMPTPMQTMTMPTPNSMVMPIMGITMPAHVPMPRPPPGVLPVSVPPPFLPFQVERAGPAHQQQQQFEAERVGVGGRDRYTRDGGRDGGRDPRSPESTATSLRTLRLTSFPVSAGPGSEREFNTGAGAGGVGGGAAAGAGRGGSGPSIVWVSDPGGGAGGGGGAGRERELSVILEHSAEGSPSPLGNYVNGNAGANGSRWYAAAPPRQQTPWTRRSSQYSDRRGMEEWRRGTDEEAPCNALPPPSPISSPGLLSPASAANANVHGNVHPHPQQQSLRRSESGSTVNITIVPPSRPPSVGHSVGLSPNHAAPAVPEEEYEEDEEDDDDDDDDDDDEDDAPPPGVVLGPLPAFAQGVTYPPGFMPMPMQPIGGRTAALWLCTSAAVTATATWTAPPLIGANAMEPVRPSSRPMQMQMGGHVTLGGGANANARQLFMVEPARPASRQGNPTTTHTQTTWGAPPFVVEPAARPASRQGNPTHTNTTAAWSAPAPEPVRPPSRQMGGILGNPNAPPFMLEPARPLSRQGNPNPANTNTAWGAPDPVRPPSQQMGEILGNPNARPPYGVEPARPQFMVEPARPLSRQGNPANTAWGAPEPAHPQSRQGGMLRNPANAGWGAAPSLTTEPAQPASRQGNAANGAWAAPPNQTGAAPGSNWTLGGQYAFGQTSTPATQTALPLGFVPSPNTAAVMPHFRQPTRPLSFLGGDTVRSTTPHPIYGPPAATAAVGTGYPAQTPGVAAGYPLPASRSNSTATITPHQRLTNLNAGTTPAAFNTRPLTSRPGSRASSRGTSASGFTRYNNNQTPNPNTNLGITNPYTSILEEEPPRAGAPGRRWGCRG